MRTPTTFTKESEEEAVVFSTNTDDSNNGLCTENLVPFLTKNDSQISQMSEDSDCMSDSSRKIRKKRNAYQKISDDIRMKLLDAVKNGETLKSAAKRYKINYSSAKSILHTYRKEGRILKKSAQERTAKKKGGASDDIDEEEEEEDSKPLKTSKKPSTFSKMSRSSVNTGVKADISSNKCSEDSPHASFSTLNDNFMSLLRVDSQSQSSDPESTLRPISGFSLAQDGRRTSTKEKDDFMKENKGEDPQDFAFKAPTKEDAPAQKIRIFGDLIENNTESNIPGHGAHEVPNYMNFYNEFDSSNDMAPWNLRKFSLSEDFCQDPSALLNIKGFNLDDKLYKFDIGTGFDEHKDPLKSFMDTQNLFRSALRKASIASFSGSIPGFRKNSMDLFNH